MNLHELFGFCAMKIFYVNAKRYFLKNSALFKVLYKIKIPEVNRNIKKLSIYITNGL